MRKHQVDVAPHSKGLAEHFVLSKEARRLHVNLVNVAVRCGTDDSLCIRIEIVSLIRPLDGNRPTMPPYM